MVIEQLTFEIPVSDHARFICHDAAIWTPALAAQPGFLAKEVWREAGAPDRLHLIIRWADRASWQAVPTEVLARTDAAFVKALGTVYPVLRCVDQDVLSA